MSKQVYINSLNFHDGKQMQVRGQVNHNPKEAFIRKGLVREAKINPPVEVKKHVGRKKRKSDHATKPDTKLDE